VKRKDVATILWAVIIPLLLIAKGYPTNLMSSGYI